jgi:hypothetical protein
MPIFIFWYKIISVIAIGTRIINIAIMPAESLLSHIARLVAARVFRNDDIFCDLSRDI